MHSKTFVSSVLLLTFVMVQSSIQMNIKLKDKVGDELGDDITEVVTWQIRDPFKECVNPWMVSNFSR